MEECNLGQALLINDYECQVKGIGKIKVCLDDRTERTLKDVRYIP